MKPQRTKSIFGLLFTVLALVFSGSGCNSSDNSSSAAGGAGQLRLQATDAPFPFDQVAHALITVTQVEARNVAGNYITLTTQVSTMDLVQLRNGLTKLLADSSVPAGQYDQLRLIISTSSIDLTTGAHYDLTVPSAAHSGLKVFLSPPVTVAAGGNQDVLLDFNLAHSFVPQGNPISGFHFEPVIRATVLEGAGTLAGTILSDNGTPSNTADDLALGGAQITVSQNGSDIASAGSDSNGNYKILGLAPGLYSVTISKTGFADQTISNVLINSDSVSTENATLVVTP